MQISINETEEETVNDNVENIASNSETEEINTDSSYDDVNIKFARIDSSLVGLGGTPMRKSNLSGTYLKDKLYRTYNSLQSTLEDFGEKEIPKEVNPL